MKKLKLIVVICFLMICLSVNCHATGVVIHHDTYGVPHIYSNSIEGLYYGWGYSIAQDRLFQLEILKRVYYGQISEIYGEDYYNLDAYWLSEYPTLEALQKSFESLDEKYQIIVRSYVDGINAWIDEVLADEENKLPLEFHELGIKPAHWTEVDAAAAMMANLALFIDLTNETIHADFYSYLKDKFGDLADSYFNDMAWIDDSSAYTTIQAEDQCSKNSSLTEKNQLSFLNHNGLTDLAYEDYKLYCDKEKMIGDLLKLLGYEVPTKIEQGAIEAMSYCVVVGSEKSETGNPWFMAGPQVYFWAPSMFYEVGLHGAGFDVEGFSIAGVPCIMFGATSTTAFSCTAGADNVVDIYEEKLNSENPLQYYYNDEWQDMVVRIEKVYVKGEAEPREFKAYSTIHGPVIKQIDLDGDGEFDLAYSKKVACFDSYLTTIPAYTELMLAKTPDEFISASEKLDLTLNFMYADNRGNIGTYHAGKFPIRPEVIDPRFPTPGTGEYEWLGFLKPEEHPQIINPDSGLIINWNNKPAADFDNGDVTSIFNWGCWSEDHRSNNLARLVNEKLPIGRQDLEEIIHEIADADLEAFAIKEFLLEALEDTTESKLINTRELLADWDNLRSDKDKDGYYDSNAITIFHEWWPIVIENIFADELGPYWDVVYNVGGLLHNYSGYSFFVRTILGEKAAVPVRNDYYNGRGWKNIFIESLEQALDQLTDKYGTSDMNQWITPIKMMQFPAIIMAGAPSGLGQIPDVKYMDRGSENHIVELTWPVVTGQNICPPGQSGFINKFGVEDPHFDDQMDLFITWKYKDMLIRKGDVLINSESTTILIYYPKY